MSEPKKLIEVAMPIKEISAESVRDKSIRHGHISTLHLWWARRPLPLCRAVVFASLVPDPLDENCPQSFKDVVEILLGKENNIGDPYRPYNDIPWTSVFDPMEDNLRNRLQMFIGKFSQEMQEHLLGRKSKPETGNILQDQSLIKWDSKNNNDIINKARKLIWVAHNSKINNKSATELLEEFNNHHQDITITEQNYYNFEDRHIICDQSNTLKNNLEKSIEKFQNRMPKVFDPFAGGGAIPLEAARLGCSSFGNDINPVAHIIQRGSLEFPQKFGKPIVYSKSEFLNLYNKHEWEKIKNEDFIFKNGERVGVRIKNRLSFDVQYFSKKLLLESENQIGNFYPKDEFGNKSIAYYWARIGTCSNPTCNAEVPLLKQFYLANTHSKKIYLNPIIKDNTIEFEIKKGECNIDAWISRGNLLCPCCGNTTDVKTLKRQFVDGLTKERLIAVIWDTKFGKEYRLPRVQEFDVLNSIPNNLERPQETMPVEYTQALPSCTWGLNKWSDMFNDKQIMVMTTFIKILNELKNDLKSTYEEDYYRGLITYLGILINRIAPKQVRFIIWDVSRETVSNLFGRQAISMIFDYAESNPFCESSGSASNQIDWIIRYIEAESNSPFYTVCNNASSGDKTQFSEKYLTAVVTDPPYYDAIAYADLSDFFYVWLKRTLGDVYPLNFSTPQTPKSDECTALKHHHFGNVGDAKKHFENKLFQIFDAIEHQTSDIVSIMFAHQSTEAWTTLCNSILKANMNIKGSWALDSEYTNTGLKANKSFLSSSVTVSCVPYQSEGIGDFKLVKNSIERKVELEVEELYRLGFRGSDLLTACFGQAVSEFGKYKKVEKADGSEVTVSELLELTRESAFNSLLKGFSGDEFTKFYIGWLQLNGFIESDFDDAAKFTKVGLSINVQDLFKEHILIKNGNKQQLATLKERLGENSRLGEGKNSSMIDIAHKLMALYGSSNRNNLLKFIDLKSFNLESPVWRIITSLAELLPKDIEDHKLAVGLLTNKDQLIREAKSSNTPKPEQGKLTFE